MIEPNPFTPHPGEAPRVLRGRAEEIGVFKRLLAKMAEKRGVTDHLVVLGEWGLGKTVLLKQFKAEAQAIGIPALLCAISKFGDDANVTKGLDLLVDLMLRQSSTAAKVVKRLKEVDVRFTIPGLTVGASKRETHPQIYLANVLVTLWGFLRAEVGVVLIDDVQNFSSISSVLDILRAVLNDDEVRAKTNWLFILACMPREWDAFLDKHHPIGRTFRIRRTVRRLNKEESSEVVVESVRDTGVTFAADVVTKVHELTSGHPYELQTLCENLYDSQIRGVVDSSVWETSLDQSLVQLGEAYFKSACSVVTEREMPVLVTLAEAHRPTSIKEIQRHLQQREDLDFPRKDTKTYVYRLVKERQLVERISRGRYEISDKMLQEYILRRLRPTSLTVGP